MPWNSPRMQKLMTSPIFWRSSLRSPGEKRLPGTFAFLLVAALLCVSATQIHAHEKAPVANSNSLYGAAIDAQARHDFDRALHLTNDLLAQQPGDDQARLLQASLHLIRGELSEAAASCRNLRDAIPLVAVSCHARVAHAANNGAEVRRRLEGLIAISVVSQIEPELLAWALSIAGDLAASSAEPYRAMRYFRDSLEVVDNPQVRASLVDVLINEGRLLDAQHALGSGASSLSLQVQDLIVRQRLHIDVSQQAARLDRRFRHWIDHEDYEHAREMARFYLDVMTDTELAAELARINAGLQHEPEDQLLVKRTQEFR